MNVKDLTPRQIDALLAAAAFVSAGEWDETITPAQKRALDQAVAKLEAARKSEGGAA